MKNLAPEIYRQRLVIEGYPRAPLVASQIKQYLTDLSDKIGMITLMEPTTHRSPTYGEAAWIHWETSGAHFYAWDQPRLFFSVDIYTCKQFAVAEALDFTKAFFGIEQLEHKEF